MPLSALSPSVVLEICLGLVLIGWVLRSTLLRSARLPPGPNPIPILGNLRLPKDPLPAFKQWADKYGDIMTVRVMGRDLLVANNHKSVTELLEKRAGSTSSRPHMTMAHDLVGFGDFPSQTNDATLHKKYRRLFASALSTRAAQNYWDIQIRELRKATLDILASPQSYTPAIKRAAAAISFLIAYGYDIESDDDVLIKKINGVLRIFEKVMTPGAFLVDSIPLLKYVPTWFPGANFKRMAMGWRDHIVDIREIPFNRVKRDMLSGKAKPSFVGTLLEEQVGIEKGNHVDEELIKWTAGSIYSAGSDTSVAAIQSFLAAMVLYPDVQAKAQAELDSVIGRERLPTIHDQDILPYCAALVQEVLRWHPVSPLALPHVLEKDEEFQGYVLPKGTAILGNVWAMTRDSTVYASPDEVKPERFLSDDGKSVQTPDSARHIAWTFGFGRRICPGSHLAEATIFAAVVSILWASTISRPAGAKETEIQFEARGVHRPKDFPIDVKPRFPGAVDMLRGGINE